MKVSISKNLKIISIERLSNKNSPIKSEISGTNPSQKPSPLKNSNLSPVRATGEDSEFSSHTIFHNSASKLGLVTDRELESGEKTKRSGKSAEEENNENVSPNVIILSIALIFKVCFF